MNTFEDIATLWKKPQQLLLPNADEIIKKANAEKGQVANKIFFQACCLMLAIVSLGFVLHSIKFEYASSYIGIALMFVCIIVFAVARFKQANFLRKANFLSAPSILLQQFEQFHQQQKWLNTKGVLWYSIFLNIAFALYFYETIFMAPLTNFWRIIILAIYITWMLVATLWLSKRSVRKEHEKTAAIIQKLKQLQNALH